MPTIQQLVRKGRESKVDKTKTPALKLTPPLQLGRLAMPRTVQPRIGEPLPGADLTRLI